MPTPVIITLLLVIYVAVCFAALVMNHRLSQANHYIDELSALNAEEKLLHLEVEQSYHRHIDQLSALNAEEKQYHFEVESSLLRDNHDLHERIIVLNNAARKMFFYSDMTSNEVASMLALMPITALVRLRDTTPADRKHLVDYAIVTHKSVPATGISEEFFDSINEMLNGMPAPVGESLPDNVMPIKDVTNAKQPSTSSRCHLCGLPFSEHLDNAAHSFEPEQPQPAIEL